MRLRRVPVRATRPCIGRWQNSNAICTSMYTLKTTSCSRGQSKWSATKHATADQCRGTQSFASAGEHHRIHCRSRGSALAFADRLYRQRLVLHATAGNVSGSVEPPGDQQPPLSRNRFSGLDTGARTRPSLWLDRQLHSWHRLLLDPKTSTDEAVFSMGAMDFIGDV